MGVFRQFPYSNFHEMNLDEIIKIIKNMLEEWAQYHATWDEWMQSINDDWSNYQEVMNEAWQDMQDFINNYFDNLDVQNEINNKITSMVNSGEFAAIVEPYIPPRVTAWLTEHITQPIGVVIDTSLTVSGACADAKSTGDAITDVQNVLGICFNYGYTQAFRPTIEVGRIQEGADTESNYYIRNTGYIESSVPFLFVRKVPSSMNIFKYSSDGTFIGPLYFTDSNTPTKLITDVDGYKYRFTFTNQPQEDVRNLVDTYKKYVVILKNESETLTDISTRINELETVKNALTVTKKLMLQNPGSIKLNGTTDDETYADTMGYSDLIRCTSGDSLEYILRGYANKLLLAFYDVNGAFISSPTVEGGPGYKTGEVTVPNNATYFRVSGLITESYYPSESLLYKPTPALIAEILNKIQNIGNIENHYNESLKAINNSFLIPSKLRFAMHRGARNEAPENTIPAFTIAGQNGAWGIETDIYESTDGVFFCHHDDTVDRMTDGSGNIAEMTAAQIEALTIDAGANIQDYPNLKIPRLTAYLNVCKKYGCIPVVEIKTITSYANLVSLIAEYGFTKSIILIGVAGGRLTNIRAITDEIAFLVIVNQSTDLTDIYDSLVSYRNVGLTVETSNEELTQSFITDAHEAGMIVGVWTVDSSTDAENWLESGVDIITSNALSSL